MGQIIKTDNKNVEIKTIVDIEQSSEAKVGDVYISNSDTEIYRLRENVTTDGYDYFNCDEYDFINGKWKNCKHQITRSTLKEYYHKAIGDVDDMIKHAVDAVTTGNVDDLTTLEDIECINDDIDETAIVSTRVDQTTLIGLNDKLDIARNRLSQIESCMKIMSKQKMNELRRLTDKLNSVIVKYKAKMEKIMKVITIIELYTGVDEELFQITSGEPSSEEGLVIRQLVLYMDEEVGDWKNGGWDFQKMHEFDEWLTNPTHRDQVIPEQKSIVFFKPRRKPKRYSNDYYHNQEMNIWNRQTYVLIRNGDNLYRVFTENLHVPELVFPKREELKKLLDKINNPNTEDRNKEYEIDKFETLNYNATRIAALINGLCHRTSIFPGNNHDMFKMDETNIRVIYDGEPSLTDGHESFDDFLKRVNSLVTDGSRIYYTGIDLFKYSWNGKPDKLRNRFVKQYYLDCSIPVQPSRGMYQVIKVDGENLGFRYMPDFSWNDRKNKVSFKIFENDTCFINYDQVTFDDINYFVNDRVSRPDYIDMMPMLIGLRDMLKADIERETDFVKMIMGLENVEESIVREAITWWKLKNKWKRSVWDDDAKATRMIRAKVNKLKYEKPIEI